MKIAIASDHGGVDLKSVIVRALSAKATLIDKGPADRTSCDYPDYAAQVALAVAAGEVDFGILICRSGIGMSMAANRYQNVRAAVCATVDAAVVTRQHNGANVLSRSRSRSSLRRSMPTRAMHGVAPSLSGREGSPTHRG